MARRRKSKRNRRSRPKTTNLLNIAQSVVLGNAVTQGLFNTNMIEFVTGRVDGMSLADSSGAVWTSNKITLPELLGSGLGRFSGEQGGPMGTAGYGGVVPFASGPDVKNFTDQVMQNVRNNGVGMMTTLLSLIHI